MNRLFERDAWHFSECAEAVREVLYPEPTGELEPKTLKLLDHPSFVATFSPRRRNQESQPLFINGCALLHELPDGSFKVYVTEYPHAKEHSDVEIPGGIARASLMPGFQTTCGLFLSRYQAGRAYEDTLYGLTSQEDLDKLEKIEKDYAHIGRELYSFNIAWEHQMKLIKEEKEKENDDAKESN